MKKGEKILAIKQAIKEFIEEHHFDDKEFSKKEIENAIQAKLDFPFTWKVSDFAAEECHKERSKDNGEFFVRRRKGFYTIKK